MTLRYIDGFDYFPAGNQAGRLEAAGYYIRAGQGIFDVPAVNNNMTTGRFSYGNCMSWNQGVGSQQSRLQLVKPITPGSSYNEGVIGLAVRIGQGSIVPFQVCFYNAVADGAQCWVEFLPNGIIKAYGAGGTVLGSTYAGAYYYDEWFYFEVKAKIDSVAGYMQCRVNTVTVILSPSSNTNNMGGGFFDAFQLSSRTLNSGSAFTAAVDDLYVLDTAGTVNNDFLGNVRVKTQFTSGAGSLAQFTAVGAATNWQAAQNLNTDDTKYNYSPTIGQEDLYHIQAIINGPVVHGMQLRGSYRQDDATQRIAHNVLKTQGGNTVEGSDKYTNQTYTYYTDIIEINPDTSAAFTGSEANLVEIGPKVYA
jgi:hypothetical protein